MAVYDLEEQEKIEDLKAWWAQYGKYVSIVVTAIAIVVIGVQGWRWYQRTQSEQASVLYQAVSDAARAQDVAKAKDPATQIVQRYAGTAYAPRAALLYAKLLYDKDDRAGAKQQLQWVVDHAGEDELKAIARFRLAQALLDEKNYDEALTIANDTDTGLSSGIVTTSLKYATDFKRNAQAGMVMVNVPTAGVDFHVPFGGSKGSSYGSREQGKYAAEFFTTVKTSYTAAG